MSMIRGTPGGRQRRSSLVPLMAWFSSNFSLAQPGTEHRIWHPGPPRDAGNHTPSPPRSGFRLPDVEPPAHARQPTRQRREIFHYFSALFPIMWMELFSFS